jgi:hypothetical protein
MQAQSLVSIAKGFLEQPSNTSLSNSRFSFGAGKGDRTLVSSLGSQGNSCYTTPAIETRLISLNSAVIDSCALQNWLDHLTDPPPPIRPDQIKD